MWIGLAFDSTLGYPGEGPIFKKYIISHNEAGLRNPERSDDWIRDFIRSDYKIGLFQETKFDHTTASAHRQALKGKGIASCFSCRDDGSPSEGTCILVKLTALGVTQNDVTFSPSANGKVVTAIIKKDDLRIKTASVYLPSEPNARGLAIDSIINSKELEGVHALGADHNMVPDVNLDTTRDSQTPYENAHSAKWESYLAGLGLEDTLRATHGPGHKLPSFHPI